MTMLGMTATTPNPNSTSTSTSTPTINFGRFPVVQERPLAPRYGNVIIGFSTILRQVDDRIEKRCPNCGTWKDLIDGFHAKSNNHKDGRQAYCKACLNGVATKAKNDAKTKIKASVAAPVAAPVAPPMPATDTAVPLPDYNDAPADEPTPTAEVIVPTPVEDDVNVVEALSPLPILPGQMSLSEYLTHAADDNIMAWASSRLLVRRDVVTPGYFRLHGVYPTTYETPMQAAPVPEGPVPAHLMPWIVKTIHGVLTTTDEEVYGFTYRV